MTSVRPSLFMPYVFVPIIFGLLFAGCGFDGAPARPKNVSCTGPTEVQDCGPGAICNNGACLTIPACTRQSDCDRYGLYCNPDFHLCGRTPLCSSDSDCMAPTRCHPKYRLCQVPTCLNGGVTCASGSTCQSDGKCGTKPQSPPGQSTPPAHGTPPAQAPPGGCTSDKDCCPYVAGCKANTVQHCEIKNGATSGTCQDGCRSHAACNKIGLDSCNGLYQCIKGGEHGDTCDEGYPKKDLDDCRFGYYCCPVLKQCLETCDKVGEKCPDTGNKCMWWFTGAKCFG